MKCGLREVKWRYDCLSDGDLDPTVDGGGLRLDPRFISVQKDEEPPLGPGMLNHDSHEFLDQIRKNNLARECL
jgi:hypothetical protein